MRIIKEYTITLDTKTSKFYEDFSKILKCPIESVLEDILKKNIETMTNFLEIIE